MKIEIKCSDSVLFSLGDTVYFKHDSSKSGTVTGILFSTHGIEYRVEWSSMAISWHYALTLSKEKGVPL